MNTIVESKQKYVRISPRKARLVIDMVRNKKALFAIEMLNFVNKKAALSISKCIKTAMADAENNFDLDKTKLIIIEARVDEAPVFKRGRLVSRGRHHPILKRNSHIVIKLSEKINRVDKIKKEEKEVKKTESIKPKKQKKKLNTKKNNIKSKKD